MGAAVSVADTKAAARSAAFARRKAAHGTVDAAPAQGLLAGLLAAERTGTVVALYDPIRTEIDPRPATVASVGRLRFAMPVIAGTGLPLIFRAWTPGAAMETGPFGVAIPAADDPVVPEVLVVPMLAFDARGYRLGYGGGFYDRTLADLRARGGRVRAIGFAYSAQQVVDLPVEPTDAPLDLVATESGLRRPTP
jgi:5-formyltetrahydrofolate cyclo-ligase